MSNEVDKYLDSVLEKRDSELGVGGDYVIMVSERNLQNNTTVVLFAIQNLTEKASRVLFDQIDENNYVTENKSILIQLLKKQTDSVMLENVDFTILPNVFTDDL